MKYLTLALFVGVISADDLLNTLQFKVSKAGQQSIEKELKDVKDKWEEVEFSKPVRNLQNSLRKFKKTKEHADIKALDAEFLASKTGQRLMLEWQDIGELLAKYHVGTHLPLKHMEEFSDEVNDVALKYEDLMKTQWADKYDKVFEAAGKTKEIAQTKRRIELYEKSAEGAAVEKEINDLKNALKNHVKVEDVPDSWKKSADLVKIEMTKGGQAEIENEVGDLEEWAEDNELTKPVRNMENSLTRLDRSDEVEELRALDRKFLATREGKKLILEWQDFGEGIKDHIQHTQHGWHIDHDGMQVIEDEVDDIIHEYHDLSQTHWAGKYKAAHDKIENSSEGKAVKRRWDFLEPSAEFQALEKELKDIKMAVKKNLKVTEIPTNLLKLEVSKAGQAEIEKEIGDLEDKWLELEFNKPVRNFQNSLKRFARSKEMKAIKKLDEQFMQTREGKKLAAEWGDFFEGIDEHTTHTQHGWHIDHDGMQILEDEVDDLKHEYMDLKDGVWHNKFKAAFKHAKESKDGKQLKRRIELFDKSAEAQALEKELKDIKAAIKKNVKMTDAANLVKLELSKAGQQEIEKEVGDLEDKWEEVEFNKPVRNFGNSLKRFKRSDEVKAIKKLDEQFMQTREGKKLYYEWQDFFEGMEDHVQTTQHGWHIDHDGMQIIDDELDDIKHEYLELKDGVWHNKFKAAIKHAKESKDGKQLKRRIDLFEQSAEAQALEKELKDIKAAIKKNVKITDNMYLF